MALSKWIDKNEIWNNPGLTRSEAEEALALCVSQLLYYLPDFTEAFPGPASFDGFYRPGPNKGWTTGFYTGELWLAYEYAKAPEEKQALLNAGNIQVKSFLDRIRKREDVDHHDMGFLFSPSCVAAYKLTGSKEGREAAALAADQLLTRFQPVGQFLQAWGAMDAPDNYRFIIDCLLNLPLLYWASEETGDEKYKQIAEQHIHTAMKYVIREDSSTWHTVFMNPETGGFDHGATCQGYQDGSAWTRGQAWGIYGCAAAYRYTGREEYIGYFERVSDYFLKHLPADLCPFWDLTFGDGDEATEPRDSSSAVIAVCGMIEMSKYLLSEKADYYRAIAGRLLKAVTDRYQVKDERAAGGRILHGTYSKKTPYNTCTEEGVDECVIWGDYYYMEALTRFLRPDWVQYW